MVVRSQAQTLADARQGFKRTCYKTIVLGRYSGTLLKLKCTNQYLFRNTKTILKSQVQ